MLNFSKETLVSIIHQKDQEIKDLENRLRIALGDKHNLQKTLEEKYRIIDRLKEIVFVGINQILKNIYKLKKDTQKDKPQNIEDNYRYSILRLAEPLNTIRLKANNLRRMEII